MTINSTKSRLTAAICATLFLASCVTHSFRPRYDVRDEDLRAKFAGVHSFALRLDATSSKRYVQIVSERGVTIDAHGHLSLQHVVNSLRGPHFVMPRTVRATWKTGVRAYDGGPEVWLGGTIVGDYTAPVAERIPDSIIDYIRKNGGTLRLKIRLKDDGILIAWDVEEWFTGLGGRGIRYVLPGGDFLEAKIFNGKVIDPGWQK